MRCLARAERLAKGMTGQLLALDIQSISGDSAVFKLPAVASWTAQPITWARSGESNHSAVGSVTER